MDVSHLSSEMALTDPYTSIGDAIMNPKHDSFSIIARTGKERERSER